MIGDKGNYIRLNPKDNVAVCLRNDADRPEVAVGHKIALGDIAPGEPIVKYGHVIGKASKSIATDEHVHTHNVALADSSSTGDWSRKPHHDAPFHNWEMQTTFQGYLRNDGRAGTRNYLLVLSTVNCSATVVKSICRHFVGAKLPQGIDGVIPVTHTQGCAQAIGGLGYGVLNRTLAGWLFHPNVVGALVVGLGCEQTTLKTILDAAPEKRNSIPIESMVIQEVGGTRNAIQKGIRLVEEIIAALPSFRRVDLPLSSIHLALNCGGSDGFSGITANPALGRVTDYIVSNNGTSVLAEIPECYGTEELLLDRCLHSEDRSKLAGIFQWWRDYVGRHDADFNNNLATGNIEGGITTIVEKSLGAVSKAGYAMIAQVLEYAQRNTNRGLLLMNTPGFDPVSVTGLVAGGANVIAFTTGRGSVFGCGIVPTLKISTNSRLFRAMSGDIDLDAGKIIDGVSVEDVAKEIAAVIIDVCSGKKTCSEDLGLGWEEFAPWQVGETL